MGTEQDTREVDVAIQKERNDKVNKSVLAENPEEIGFSDAVFAKAILKAAFLNCIQRKNIKRRQKSAMVFDSAFQTIKHSTGLEHIGDIVKIFVDYEQANYSLLTFVNSLDKEIQRTIAQQKARETEERLQKQRDESRRHEIQKVLAPTEERLKKTEAAIQDMKVAMQYQREGLTAIIPLILLMAEHIDVVGNHLRQWGLHSTELPQERPRAELALDNMADWLKWLEAGLGKFRETIPPPADGGVAFPATVDNWESKMYAKRVVDEQQPVIKTQELPTTLSGDAAGKYTRTQQLLDEDSDEEDLDRPLELEELRQKATHTYEMRAKRKTRSAQDSKADKPTFRQVEEELPSSPVLHRLTLRTAARIKDFGGDMGELFRVKKDASKQQELHFRDGSDDGSSAEDQDDSTDSPP